MCRRLCPKKTCLRAKEHVAPILACDQFSLHKSFSMADLQCIRKGKRRVIGERGEEEERVRRRRRRRRRRRLRDRCEERRRMMKEKEEDDNSRGE